MCVVWLQVFHAPSFGDEDFELTTTTTTTLRPHGTGGQQTSTTVDQPHDDDDRSPTSPDTGCWSSPDVSRSPSCDVEPRRSQPFQQVVDAADARPNTGGDDSDICLLKLPAPDEFHIPDIRYAEFYRHRQLSLNLPAVSYAAPPLPPRYPVGYGALMRPGASTDPCLLMDGNGRLPLRCDRGIYEYGAPAGAAVCYNGVGLGVCDNGGSAADMLLRQDTASVLHPPSTHL